MLWTTSGAHLLSTHCKKLNGPPEKHSLPVKYRLNVLRLRVRGPNTRWSSTCGPIESPTSWYRATRHTSPRPKGRHTPGSRLSSPGPRPAQDTTTGPNRKLMRRHTSCDIKEASNATRLLPRICCPARVTSTPSPRLMSRRSSPIAFVCSMMALHSAKDNAPSNKWASPNSPHGTADIDACMLRSPSSCSRSTPLGSS